ncbi:MAG: sulfatase-like hydrolase/transferase [Planctomycetes bacterium]|nr:sulfatase-like hydrolase/transferase [Planctomycetota bacterium]
MPFLALILTWFTGLAVGTPQAPATGGSSPRAHAALAYTTAALSAPIASHASATSALPAPAAPPTSPLALPSAAELPATPTRATPNVLVILLDDVGCERLRPFGQGAPYARTPVLQSLAARGVTFTNCYSNPLCGPTRALLQTGRYAFRTGFGPNIFPNYQFGLNHLETCLPELLRDGFAPGPSPYVSGAFGKWHISMYVDTTHPNDCGFGHFAGCMTNVSDQSELFGTFYHNYHWRKVVDGVESIVGTPDGPYSERQWAGSVQARDAAEWMLAQTQPFFAQLAFNPPHAPYQVPPFSLISPASRNAIEALGVEQIGVPYGEGDFAWITDLTHPTRPITEEQLRRKKLLFYDAMLEATDLNIGDVLARIEPKLADTMIFLLSDNGPESSVVDPARYDPNRAKRTCYQLGVHVPLIVVGPMVSTPGRRVDHPVGVVDLWRTIRDVTGAREVPGMIPSDVVIDSRSFLPYLADPNAPLGRRYAFSEVFNPIGNPANMSLGARQRMITDGRWKLVRTGLDDIEELYDLATDPREIQNLLPSSNTTIKAHRDELALELDSLIYSDG